MKLLLIDVNFGAGSTGKIVQSLQSHALQNGIEAVVCYGRGSKVNDSGVFKFGLDWETCLHAGLTRVTGYTGRYSYFSTRRLIHFIENYKPDIVHIHELHAYFVSLQPLLMYLAEKRIPIVWTFHCEFMYTGKCGHAYDCNRWQTKCGCCPQLHEYVGTLWFDKTAEMLAEKKLLMEGLELTIVTPSTWLASRVAQSFLRDRPIFVIRNGVDTDVFHCVDTRSLREEIGIDGSSKIVLALAPNLMSKNKGGRHVIELAKRFEQTGHQFLMVGVSKPENYQAPSNVTMLPPTMDRSKLAAYYSLADVFVICSERENYPTTCLEAQACGTPVVGFDVGGVKEAIRKGGVVPFGDLDAMQSLIEVLLENTEDDDADQLWLNSEQMVFDYLALYRNIVLEKSG